MCSATIAYTASPCRQQSNSQINPIFNKRIGIFTRCLDYGENSIHESTPTESMSDSSSDNTCYVDSFQVSRCTDASSGNLCECGSQISTKTIPFPNTYIRRTESENQLMKDMAVAEMRDWQMLKLIVSGVQRNNSTNPRIQRAAVEKILRRHSADISEYVDHDAIAAMSIHHSQDSTISNGSGQDWIIGDTFQDCIFEMDL